MDELITTNSIIFFPSLWLTEPPPSCPTAWMKAGVRPASAPEVFSLQTFGSMEPDSFRLWIDIIQEHLALVPWCPGTLAYFQHFDTNIDTLVACIMVILESIPHSEIFI